MVRTRECERIVEPSECLRVEQRDGGGEVNRPNSAVASSTDIGFQVPRSSPTASSMPGPGRRAILVPSAMVWDTDGTGAGFHTDLEASPRERIAQVADQVQEFVIEARSAAGLPSNWPPCPVHPDRHPLAPTASEPPSWTCPTTKTTVAPIGEFGSAASG